MPHGVDVVPLTHPPLFIETIPALLDRRGPTSWWAQVRGKLCPAKPPCRMTTILCNAGAPCKRTKAHEHGEWWGSAACGCMSGGGLPRAVGPHIATGGVRRVCRAPRHAGPTGRARPRHGAPLPLALAVLPCGSRPRAAAGLCASLTRLLRTPGTHRARLGTRRPLQEPPGHVSWPTCPRPPVFDGFCVALAAGGRGARCSECAAARPHALRVRTSTRYRCAARLQPVALDASYCGSVHARSPNVHPSVCRWWPGPAAGQRQPAPRAAPRSRRPRAWISASSRTMIRTPP